MLNIMNQDQWLSLLRTVLQIVGSILVTKGVISADQAESISTAFLTISGALIVVGPTIWGLLTRTDAAQLKSVAAMPDVKQIVVNANSGDGVGRTLADPTQPKVVSQ